ncbi:MAG: CoA-binding protein [Aquificaceae bacterium]|nr:CoA-binding protein [Aquificaceae bacterium]
MEHSERALEVLKSSKVVAILGVSKDPERPSYDVSKKLIDAKKHKVYLVNPNYANEVIHGIKVLSSLEDIKEPIDILNVFRNPKHLRPILEEAIKLSVKYVWLQPGSEDESLIKEYSDRLNIIYNACIGVEAAYLSLT